MSYEYNPKYLSTTLKVVMKNVPNASEYVVVCKILNEAWEYVCNRYKIKHEPF